MVLVGCGAVSRFFYSPALKELTERGYLYLKTLVDPVKENSDTLAMDFPLAGRAEDIKEVGLSKENLVIIASPPRFHASQSIFALGKGASVLCEKPMAATSAEAKEMIKSEQANSGILAVGHYRRFYPATETIKNIIEHQPLGNLKRFTLFEGSSEKWQARSDSFYNKESTPGGVFFDLGIHVVDLILWWLGEPTEFAYEDDAMGGFEANCRLQLKYKDSCQGEIHLSKDWENENHHTFLFEKGFVRWKVGDANGIQISLEGMDPLLSGKLKGHIRSETGISEKDELRTDPQSFIEQLRHVVAAMYGEETLKVSGEIGLQSLKFIESCYAEKKLMTMPWLTKDEARNAKHLASLSRENLS